MSSLRLVVVIVRDSSPLLNRFLRHQSTVGDVLTAVSVSRSGHPYWDGDVKLIDRTVNLVRADGVGVLTFEGFVSVTQGK